MSRVDQLPYRLRSAEVTVIARQYSPVGSWWPLAAERRNPKTGLAFQTRCQLVAIPDQSGVPLDERVVGGSCDTVVVDHRTPKAQGERDGYDERVVGPHGRVHQGARESDRCELSSKRQKGHALVRPLGPSLSGNGMRS